MSDAPGDISGPVHLSRSEDSTRPVAGGNARRASVFRREEARQEFGRYRILGELGAGGMGKVYLALDPTLGRRVALKVMLGALDDPRTKERFLREARAIARLQHPGIVAIHDVGEEDGEPYFTMDYVEGRDLAQLANLGLPVERGARILAQAARAVEAAHQAGVIHRDLKPSNVLVDRDGKARVLDFGLARVVDESLSALSRSGTLIGTPAYMAPEQINPACGDIDARTDVWALGAILYEIAVGQRPFQGGNEAALFYRIMTTDPVRPRSVVPTLPRDLETIALKALERKKDARYPSAAAFAEDLERHLAGEPILARPLGPFVWAVRWMRRHRVVVAAAVVLLVGILGWRLASRRTERAAEDAAATTRSNAEIERRARERAEKIEAAKESARGFPARLEEANTGKPDARIFDSLRGDLDRLSRSIQSIDWSAAPASSPAASPATLAHWEDEIDLGTGRAIVEDEIRERFPEARECLSRVLAQPTASEGTEEARWWTTEIDWLELPGELRKWPDPRDLVVEKSGDRPRLERLIEGLSASSLRHRPEADPQRAKLLCHLGRGSEAGSVLGSLREDHARLWARSDPRALFDLYRGIVLAAYLEDPPDLKGVEDAHTAAMIDWNSPDPKIYKRSLFVGVAHAAVLPFWCLWLRTGEVAEIERVRDWLEPAYDTSNQLDWIEDGTLDLPWMLGVALVVTGNTEKGSKCLADATNSGYVPAREPRYENLPALQAQDAFRKALARAGPGIGKCR
ncbi:MAG: serine/threonine protein kinase [Planctomycetes bacterium]|nr:serine/threonine protein kinase [Planctomycetota bacterium]